MITNIRKGYILSHSSADACCRCYRCNANILSQTRWYIMIKHLRKGYIFSLSQCRPCELQIILNISDGWTGDLYMWPIWCLWSSPFYNIVSKTNVINICHLHLQTTIIQICYKVSSPILKKISFFLINSFLKYPWCNKLM